MGGGLSKLRSVLMTSGNPRGTTTSITCGCQEPRGSKTRRTKRRARRACWARRRLMPGVAPADGQLAPSPFTRELMFRRPVHRPKCPRSISNLAADVGCPKFVSRMSLDAHHAHGRRRNGTAVAERPLAGLRPLTRRILAIRGRDPRGRSRDLGTVFPMASVPGAGTPPGNRCCHCAYALVPHPRPIYAMLLTRIDAIRDASSAAP